MMKAEYRESAGFLQKQVWNTKDMQKRIVPTLRKTGEMGGVGLLERILDRDNLNSAYKRVKSNKGAAGVDAIGVDEALPWLKEHGRELTESIRTGKYKPSPVRRKESQSRTVG